MTGSEEGVQVPALARQAGRREVVGCVHMLTVMKASLRCYSVAEWVDGYNNNPYNKFAQRSRSAVI
jgi:hypothetical protein